jgi:hypothetical protein
MEERVKEAGTGEPTIYDGQHTSEPHTVLKAGPDIGAIVIPIWEIADERRLRHDRRTDIALKGKESGNQNGGRRIQERIPAKPLLRRATSLSDSRGNPPSTR